MAAIPLGESLAWDFIDHAFPKDVLAEEYRRSLEAIYTPPYDPVRRERPEPVPTPRVDA